MKKLILVVLSLITINVFGQSEEVQTEIKSENIFELSILEIFPESFPAVSVVFQAKNEFGKPLWTLDKSELQVTENGVEAEVLKLLNISKDKPVNVGLVFDHSGSMVDNPMQMPNGVQTMQDYYYYGYPFPKDYVMAIDYAKEGVLGFLDETTVSKDSILFVGFSTTVEHIEPLTNEVSKIKSIVEEIQPDGFTALYDALYVAIEELSNSTSKSVIVALTDGQDNQSLYTSEEVIEFANAKDITIYTIGLGYVDSDLLHHISEQTDGFYYHTNDPGMLKEIYLNIKEQIKSIYQVDYTSNSLNNLEEAREIQFSFVNDTLAFSSDSNTKFYTLPEETIEHIERNRGIQGLIRRNKLVVGGVSVIALGLGGFIVYRRRR